MVAMLRSAIEEQHYEALTEAQVQRMGRLITDELRRGRHPYRLRDFLLEGESATTRFELFKIVLKKLDLIPLAGATYPICVRQSLIADKFKEARARRITNAAAGSCKTGEVVDDETPKPAPARVRLEDVTPQQLKNDAVLNGAVARWFEAHVPRKSWIAVADRAIYETAQRSRLAIQLPATRELARLIDLTRPVPGKWNLDHDVDHVCHFVDWLLTWLYGYRQIHAHVSQTVRRAYHLANSRDPLPAGAN